MKVLLALSLLLFLDFVFSQENFIPCNLLEKCPKGYTPQYSGRTQQVAACICLKDPPPPFGCEYSVTECRFGLDGACSDMESICSPTEIVKICNDRSFLTPEICDRANQKITKEKYAKTQKQCENLKNDCIKRGGYTCNAIPYQCDPDTTVQLCKGGAIYSRDICEAAEIQKEKDRSENTKYSCNRAQEFCSTTSRLNTCPNIATFCGVETAAKWCYKDNTNLIEKISDEDCSRIVKKSQYLMFGKSKQECWKQLPLCEAGNSEACMQVPTYCVKDIVSALCHAKKITDKRICTFAGSDKTTSPSHPGCGFFGDRCVYDEGEYCSLAIRYCDNDTIRSLCRDLKITDPSICKRVQGGNSNSFAIPIPIPIIGGTIQVPNILGF